MSARKRKEPEVSTSNEDREPPTIQDITTTVPNLKNNKYGVSYIVNFTKPCCDNHKNNPRRRIFINAEFECFKEGANATSLIMCKTIEAIKKHKCDMKVDGLDACRLDVNVGDSALYMKSNELVGSPWRHLWASAENNINKMRLDSIKR